MSFDPAAMQRLNDALADQDQAAIDVLTGRHDPADLRPRAEAKDAMFEALGDMFGLDADDQADDRIRDYVSFCLNAFQARFIIAPGTEPGDAEDGPGIVVQYLPRTLRRGHPAWEHGPYDPADCERMFGYDIADDLRARADAHGHVDITLASSASYPPRPTLTT